MLATKDILIKFRMEVILALRSAWVDKDILFLLTEKKQDAHQVVHHVLKANCLVSNVLMVTYLKEIFA